MASLAAVLAVVVVDETIEYVAHLAHHLENECSAVSQVSDDIFDQREYLHSTNKCRYEGVSV